MISQDIPMPEIILVTGMSGAGRSSTLKIFENMGYNVIDNLPCFMLEQLFVGIRDNKLEGPLVAGFNVRSLEAGRQEILELIKKFRQIGDLKLLFLDADNETLLKRFNVTRQRHPLESHSLKQSLLEERKRLEDIKSLADHVVDTSTLSVVTLGRVLRNIFIKESNLPLQIRLVSFSYRLGLPTDADMIFDARFLENPYYVEELREKTGCNPSVAAFIESNHIWPSVLEHMKHMLLIMIMGFKNSGRTYLTIGVGCTGGQHRSVFVAETLGSYFQTLGENINIEHRDCKPVEKEAKE